MFRMKRVCSLLLMSLCAYTEFTDACSCSPTHPQQAYCQADVVIRAGVVKQKEVVTGNDTSGNPVKMIQYTIKQTKMFKGPKGEIDTILTGLSAPLCGVHLESDNKEYLITGRLDSNGALRVNLCDYIQSWESLSLTQKKNLGQRYQMGCECKIVQCSFVPCSITTDVECLWTDWVMEETVQGTQAQYYTCIKRNDGHCSWYRGSAPPKPQFPDMEDP